MRTCADRDPLRDDVADPREEPRVDCARVTTFRPGLVLPVLVRLRVVVLRVDLRSRVIVDLR